MKTYFGSLLLCFLLGVVGGCVSTPGAGTVTSTQQVWANATEDVLSIALVPILTKNVAYIAEAQGIANSLGAFSGSTITPDDVNAFLSKTRIAPADQKLIAGVVNAAWANFQKRYAQQAGAAIRPDVKLFLAAVSNGITAAIAAVPK